jgi:hypothetical protein
MASGCCATSPASTAAGHVEPGAFRASTGGRCTRIKIKAIEIVTANPADAKDLLRIEALLTEREDIDFLINADHQYRFGPWLNTLMSRR